MSEPAGAHQQGACLLRLVLLEPVGLAARTPTLGRHRLTRDRLFVVVHEQLVQGFVQECLGREVHAQLFDGGCVALPLDLVAAGVTHAHFLEHLRDRGSGQVAAKLIPGEHALDVWRGVIWVEADTQLFDEDADAGSDGPGAVDVGQAGGVGDLALAISVDELVQLAFSYSELSRQTGIVGVGLPRIEDLDARMLR